MLIAERVGNYKILQIALARLFIRMQNRPETQKKEPQPIRLRLNRRQDVGREELFQCVVTPANPQI